MSLSKIGVPPKKTALRGGIPIPGDKSITHRSIILSALAEGKSQIVGYLPSEDCHRTIEAFRAMGISFRSGMDNGVPTLEVEGKGLRGLIEPEEVIDCGNSGTTMRLMTGLLSGQSFFSVLSGDGSLRSRPMRRIVDPLRLMGGEIHGRSEGSLAPLAISGKALNPIEYTLPIPSAQVKSAILLAGLTLSGRTTIHEPSPSRDHTERMLKYFGVQFEKKKNRLSVDGGIPFQSRTIEVPGDISSAAFFLVAATIMPGSEVVLRKVGINPTRSGILDVLQGMGADITVQSLSPVLNEPIADIVVRSSSLKGLVIEGALARSVLDEFPVLCIAAAKAEGKTVFRGAKELRFKESDRIEMMAAGLRGMGVKVDTFSDGIEIEGKPVWKGTVCKTKGDHRIAMAMAVAGLIAEGGNKIDDTHCISTSFPGFFDLMSGLLVS